MEPDTTFTRRVCAVLLADVTGFSKLMGENDERTAHAVHHLQAINNVRVSCPAALEREAYDLQFKWLREQGVEDPYEYSGLNVLTVILAGICPE